MAQKLLIKQLERYDLQVVATSNGEEAITGQWLSCYDVVETETVLKLEWESRESGFFSVALFDHRE